MLMLTQAPNGRCRLTHSSSSPKFPNSNPNSNKQLFSQEPKFISRNHRKPLNLTLVASAESSRVFVGDERVPLEGVIQFDKQPNFDFSSKLNKWGRVALLCGGDVLALLVFSAIGRFSHGFPVFGVETLHTADPFIAGWFLGAYFLGGYGSEGRGMDGMSKAVVAAAKSWGVGIPLGIIIRAATAGHVPPARFILVTMGSTAVLLIGWRALLFTILPKDKGKNNDAYKRGSPFELFELLTSLVRRW
ncbi:transmembrane protein [Thalictrum thalictroides]|uniref:Transmembrane protein n=1 Tax=Thalictrum thalictroides TaxID=46969 RepID=A0A7J6X9J0_THATH|nr:transmembrane protein [Thalictrum thalictroides]